MLIRSRAVTYSRNTRSSQHSHQRYGQSYNGTQEFTCMRCGLFVAFVPEVAGVQNRNHCPYCLWSRHLDWRTAGDRLSNCRAAMEPVGLTTKRGRNKYARERDGELMIVHRCAGCATLVINRIAADDSAAAILAVFERSCAEDLSLPDALVSTGVSMLGIEERALVLRRLLGNQAINA
jgi:DNA-directed RNA polymerase subunit RPC12/RpoP